MKAAIFVALVALALCPLFTVNCTAQDNTAIMKALALQKACDTPEGTPTEGYCLGFIAGVSQSTQIDDPAAATVCFPEEVNLAEAKQVVRKYLNDHPQNLHLAGAILVKRALIEAWPCSAKTK
jgi:hypothetical protein